MQPTQSSSLSADPKGRTAQRPRSPHQCLGPARASGFARAGWVSGLQLGACRATVPSPSALTGGSGGGALEPRRRPGVDVFPLIAKIID